MAMASQSGPVWFWHAVGLYVCTQRKRHLQPTRCFMDYNETFWFLQHSVPEPSLPCLHMAYLTPVHPSTPHRHSAFYFPPLAQYPVEENKSVRFFVCLANSCPWSRQGSRQHCSKKVMESIEGYGRRRGHDCGTRTHGRTHDTEETIKVGAASATSAWRRQIR